MFVPKIYENKNQGEIIDFVHKHSFGQLITAVDAVPYATHIPLQLVLSDDGKHIIYGHIARANPQWKHWQEGQDVLCIFNGPHCYISSSWYQQETAPTWNYIAAHIRGELYTLDEEETLKSLDLLVSKYEQDSHNPIRMRDFSDKTMRLVHGIVAFKIIITDIQATKKLSQNRSDEDYRTILQKLESRNQGHDMDILTAMKQIRPDLD